MMLAACTSGYRCRVSDKPWYMGVLYCIAESKASSPVGKLWMTEA
jgi:hypothetical protein